VAFLDTLFPHYFFSHFSPFEVIKREIPVMVRQTKESPAGDSELLRQFADDASRAGYPSLASWFLSNHAVRKQMKQDLTQMGSALLAGFDGLRQQFDSDPSYAAMALQNIKESTRPACDASVAPLPALPTTGRSGAEAQRQMMRWILATVSLRALTATSS
jgi:hypothetical protein